VVVVESGDHVITAYKCTRADGTDFRTGKVDYSKLGVLVDEPRADRKSKDSCGSGLHVSTTARLTCQFGERNIDRGKWRWFEVEVDEADVLGKDSAKMRVAKLTPKREIFKEEIFGADIAERIARMRVASAEWKTIPWLKPPRAVTQEEIADLLAEFHEAITPLVRSYHLNYNRHERPRRGRIVTDLNTVQRCTGYDGGGDDVAADDAAVVAVAGAADDDIGDVAGAADEAAEAASARFARFWPYDGVWWYVRPYYVMWRYARCEIVFGKDRPNPFRPLLEMMKLGCAPLGYTTLPRVSDEVAFAVYVPPVKP